MLNFQKFLHFSRLFLGIAITVYAIKLIIFISMKCVVVTNLKIGPLFLLINIIAITFVFILWSVTETSFKHYIFSFFSLECLKLLFLLVLGYGIYSFGHLKPDMLTGEFIANEYIKIIYIADIAEKQEWLNYLRTVFYKIPDQKWSLICKDINLEKILSLQELINEVDRNFISLKGNDVTSQNSNAFGKSFIFYLIFNVSLVLIVIFLNPD